MSESQPTAPIPRGAEPDPADAPPGPTPLALIEEATKKSGLVWVEVPGGDERPRSVWHAWQDGSAYVLSGGSEQPLPGIEQTGTAAVSVRSKDKGHRLVVWEARVARVEPGTEEWAAVTPTLLGKRLNLPDGEAAVERWARECVLSRLTPSGRLIESPGDGPADAELAPPPPTPATAKPALPFHLGDRRRRKVR